MNDLLTNFVWSLVLLPGPVLPDVSGLFAASTPAAEHRAAEPVMAPSIDRVLAMPNGFRAPGYEALSFSRKAN